MAGVPQPAFVRRLDRACVALGAVASLLGQVSEVVRHLVYVLCWLALLVGSIGLLLHPSLSPEQLVISGTGALAVLRTRRTKGKSASGTSSTQLGVPSRGTGMSPAAPMPEADAGQVGSTACPIDDSIEPETSRQAQ
jgi:hypothetical protein